MIKLPTLVSKEKKGGETKPGKGSRKDFVRTKIALGENISSVVILLIIVGIGVGVAIEGAHFDPDLYTVRSGSLDATAAPVVGKSQTIETPAPSTAAAAPSDMANAPSDTGEAPAADGGNAAPAAAPAAAALPTEPMNIDLPGIKPMSDTEFYTADTLYEKIDGRSPAYQAFNVQQLRGRTFSVLAASGSYVDVYEYRFDTPLDAFGMFSSERDPQGKPVDFAPDGYSSGMGYFFRQGPVYVQIIASDQKPETLAIALALARNRAKVLPVDDTGVAARRELPATGMIADSVSFMLDNAQGQSYLKNVFQAKYNFEGTVLPFFIMIAPTDDEATKAWTALQKFCASFGKVELLPDVNGGKIFRAQVFGAWKVVYLRNKSLGGVFDATNADKARAFVEQYLATTNAPSATANAPSDTANAPSVTANASENADNASAGGSSSPAAAPMAALATKPMDITLPGIKPMSDTEFYTADTLYEKIDGRSPAYQAFNVQGLRCRTFLVLAASGSYVDVNEYRFDTPLDAFGMFSSERDPQGKPVDFAPDGYSSGMGYFFRQGPVYVQIIASDQKPETLAIALALAQNRAKVLPVDDTGVAARRELPTTGMVADSVTFMLDNSQGQSYLKNVFQAKYNFQGTQLSFFIMVAPTDDEATKAWTAFQKFCAGFGKVELLPDVNGGKIFRAQVFGKWKVVYLRNKELGGVFDATDGDKARAFTEQYLQGKIK